MPGAEDIYSIDVKAGEEGYFRAAPDCSQTAGLRWRIESANGEGQLVNSSICSDIGKIVFAKAGQFRLHVYSYAGGTGSYRVSWAAR
jgi:hypothetical protein